MSISIQSDGSFFARIPTRALGARLPPPALEILRFCAVPRQENEVQERYGPMGEQLFRQLRDAGLLLTDEAETPQFFQNFAALDVHRRMLSDRVRLDVYAEALRRAVRPGMVVLDAGTGSGVLACLAANAGARVVYAVDNADILEAAKNVIRASGLEERVIPLRGDFRTLQLPEPVDLVVTETFGAWALAEAGMEDLIDTCARHLKPGGRLLPGAVDLWMAPISAPEPLQQAFGPFQTYGGVHLEALLPSARSRGITLDLLPTHLGGPPVRVARIPLPGRVAFESQFRLQTDQPLQGLACWFDLDFGDELRLSSSPSAPSTHWRQHLLPLTIAGQEAIEIDLQVRAAQEDRRGLEIQVGWKRGTEEGNAWFRLR